MHPHAIASKIWKGLLLGLQIEDAILGARRIDPRNFPYMPMLS